VDKHRFVRRWLAFGLFLTCGASASAAPAAGSARACLSFRSEAAEKSLLYRAKNRCDRPVDCRISYRVTCRDLDGKETAVSDEERAFDVAAKQTQTVTLSADTCEHSWAIGDVDWDCS
jgi:hypothetical protein